jgi:hypothetical protein
MPMAQVDDVIRREYPDWKKHEITQEIQITAKAAPLGTYTQGLELKTPTERGNSLLPELYEVYFTSPLSGSAVYVVARTRRFGNRDPENSLTYEEWSEAFSSIWGPSTLRT